MTKTIQREILFPQPREQVWRAITDSATLAEWMFPNDFVPRVGHRFTFQVPGNPKVNFDGLTVRCEVLECEPPSSLTFSWSAGGAVENTRVSFRLEPDGEGTRILFEHSGFDISQPFGNQALKGAEFGWAKMLGQLSAVVAELVEAHMIWNRACGEHPLRVLPGDRALVDLLYAHGLAMNGGVLHAVECMTAEELSNAQVGYRFYGFDDVASLLSRARRIFEAADDLGSHEQGLDGEYAQFIPTDSSVVKRFQMRLKSRPSDFAPFRAKDVG